ncbi:pyridoxal phosphate-dependent transferase [Phaeosphaeria sp. MPI-PUGE-AT-0046c]|nr:pyridoxal phosphate-dependent transferase [Phaeosphaeria sp. MPI-PUGE-AT-0046c]
MDYGLSTRMQSAVEEFAPTTPPTHSNTANVIDLSTAQNEVLRPELVEFFKSTVEDKATGNVCTRLLGVVFALPPGNGGDPQDRAALATFFNTYFNPIHAVKPEHVVLTAGTSDAIERVVHAVCEEGDSVLVPGPMWHGFSPMLRTRANVNIITASPPTYDNWDNYLAASLQAVYDFSAEKSRIKAVLLCNPHNPFSRCYPKKVLLEVMEFCQEHGLHLIVDEIYALTDLNSKVKGAAPFVSALSLTEPLVPEGAVKIDPSRVHVVWSASKLFGMSGFRIRLSAAYSLLAAMLTKHAIEFIAPSHGLFLFARLGKHASTAAEEKVCFEALEREGVRVGEGRFYRGVEGKFGWARVSFSLGPDVMREGMGRLDRFLEKRG